MSAVVGLVDDDFGMELLVGGAIISLSLPVRLVWECVWRPTLPSAGSETTGDCHNHERKEKTAPFGVNLMRSQVLCRAAHHVTPICALLCVCLAG